jgi:subtilisin family serine protease
LAEDVLVRAFILSILVVSFAAAAPAAPPPLVPNDTYYATRQWYGDLMGFPEAFGISTGSPGVIVAILDTGVMADTPDLAGRILPAFSVSSYPTTDGLTVHHGTWVAGAVAMGVNNGQGGAGVGNFSVLPVVVTDVYGHNTSEWIAAGIRAAADAGARVINVSHSTLSYSLLDDAAAYALERGALTFVAAGNSDARSPMRGYEHLVFVSGTNALDERWSQGGLGSTWGPFVDIAAPADDIVVPDPHNAALPNGYGLIDGTSFAAPLAAGAAALAWSINPDLTPQQVLAMLYDTAVDLGEPGWDEVFGHGRLNVGGVALAAWRTTPEPATLALLAAGTAVIFARRREKKRGRV